MRECQGATSRLSETLRQSFSWCFNTSSDLTVEKKTDDYRILKKKEKRQDAGEREEPPTRKGPRGWKEETNIYAICHILY